MTRAARGSRTVSTRAASPTGSRSASSGGGDRRRRPRLHRAGGHVLLGQRQRAGPQCSYKGGDPGFVRVLDDAAIAFPCYDGNGMYLSIGNVLVTAHVGLLFVDFEGGKRLRLHGGGIER
ncbi:MAG: pyridoxamine 5'-phosphate oxidase family protein [Gaiellaceae bacterium]